jgi:hypothetical protein
MANKWLLRTFMAAWLLAAVLSVSADDYKATAEEMEMCKATVFSLMPPPPLGPNWGHMHHYCDCVRFTNRAVRVMYRDKQEFGHNLTDAFSNCDYVLSATTNDFELRPDLHLQKAKIYSMWGKDALAAAEFTRTLDASTKFVSAYVGLADTYRRLHDLAKALEIVSDG